MHPMVGIVFWHRIGGWVMELGWRGPAMAADVLFGRAARLGKTSLPVPRRPGRPSAVARTVPPHGI